MTPRRNHRWLAVARRAAAMRLLQGHGDLSRCARQAADSQRALSQTEALAGLIVKAWAQGRAQAVFHADGEQAYRHFLASVDEQRRQEQRLAVQAAGELDQCHAAVLRLMSERDLVGKIHQQTLQAERKEQEQQAQKLSDDLWSRAFGARRKEEGG